MGGKGREGREGTPVRPVTQRGGGREGEGRECTSDLQLGEREGRGRAGGYPSQTCRRGKEGG